MAKRGRPRKYPIAKNAEKAPIISIEYTEKRKRGRPPKKSIKIDIEDDDDNGGWSNEELGIDNEGNDIDNYDPGEELVINCQSKSDECPDLDAETIDEVLSNKVVRDDEAALKKELRKRNKELFYVDPDVLAKEIREYYETGVMTGELGDDIRKICERLLNSWRFCNYTYKDEMAAEAFVKCYRAIYFKKFDIDKGFSPFSYLTQIAFNAAIAVIKSYKKEREICEAYRDEYYDRLKMESAESVAPGENNYDENEYEDYIN